MESKLASDIQTALDVAVPFEFIHLPFQLLSVGEVEETKAANKVVGLADGFPFSALSKSKVEVV